jgi:hypothetical protein
MMHTTSSPGKIKVLVDYFGPVSGNQYIESGVAKFPPTIIFHNYNDDLVFPENSRNLDALLSKHGIQHAKYEYKELGQPFNHPFAPGGNADQDSRKKATEWLNKHLPPTGN